MSNIDWSKLITKKMKNEAAAAADLAQRSAVELEWRAQQMPIAQQAVTAIQFGEEDIPGTEQEWKAYWLALRKWTEANPDFPDSDKRPAQPD